jgi:hypothetical protein
VGPPTGRGVEAENPPTVTARSTVGAGVFFFRSSDVFAEYPHWQVSEKQAREVRTELYKVLLRTPAAGAADRGTREPGPTYDVIGIVARILQVVEQAEG